MTDEHNTDRNTGQANDTTQHTKGRRVKQRTKLGLTVGLGFTVTTGDQASGAHETDEREGAHDEGATVRGEAPAEGRASDEANREKEAASGMSLSSDRDGRATDGATERRQNTEQNQHKERDGDAARATDVLGETHTGRVSTRTMDLGGRKDDEVEQRRGKGAGMSPSSDNTTGATGDAATRRHSDEQNQHHNDTEYERMYDTDTDDEGSWIPLRRAGDGHRERTGAVYMWDLLRHQVAERNTRGPAQARAPRKGGPTAAAAGKRTRDDDEDDERDRDGPAGQKKKSRRTELPDDEEDGSGAQAASRSDESTAAIINRIPEADDDSGDGEEHSDAEEDDAGDDRETYEPDPSNAADHRGTPLEEADRVAKLNAWKGGQFIRAVDDGWRLTKIDGRWTDMVVEAHSYLMHWTGGDLAHARTPLQEWVVRTWIDNNSIMKWMKRKTKGLEVKPLQLVWAAVAHGQDIGDIHEQIMRGEWSDRTVQYYAEWRHVLQRNVVLFEATGPASSNVHEQSGMAESEVLRLLNAIAIRGPEWRAPATRIMRRSKAALEDACRSVAGGSASRTTLVQARTFVFARIAAGQIWTHDFIPDDRHRGLSCYAEGNMVGGKGLSDAQITALQLSRNGIPIRTDQRAHAQNASALLSTDGIGRPSGAPKRMEHYVAAVVVLGWTRDKAERDRSSATAKDTSVEGHCTSTGDLDAETVKHQPGPGTRDALIHGVSRTNSAPPPPKVDAASTSTEAIAAEETEDGEKGRRGRAGQFDVRIGERCFRGEYKGVVGTVIHTRERKVPPYLMYGIKPNHGRLRGTEIWVDASVTEEVTAAAGPPARDTNFTFTKAGEDNGKRGVVVSARRHEVTVRVDGEPEDRIALTEDIGLLGTTEHRTEREDGGSSTATEAPQKVVDEAETTASTEAASETPGTPGEGTATGDVSTSPPDDEEEHERLIRAVAATAERHGIMLVTVSNSSSEHWAHVTTAGKSVVPIVKEIRELIGGDNVNVEVVIGCPTSRIFERTSDDHEEWTRSNARSAQLAVALAVRSPRHTVITAPRRLDEIRWKDEAWHVEQRLMQNEHGQVRHTNKGATLVQTIESADDTASPYVWLMIETAGVSREAWHRGAHDWWSKLGDLVRIAATGEEGAVAIAEIGRDARARASRLQIDNAVGRVPACSSCNANEKMYFGDEHPRSSTRRRDCGEFMNIGLRKSSCTQCGEAEGVLKKAATFMTNAFTAAQPCRLACCDAKGHSCGQLSVNSTRPGGLGRHLWVVGGNRALQQIGRDSKFDDFKNSVPQAWYAEFARRIQVAEGQRFSASKYWISVCAGYHSDRLAAQEAGYGYVPLDILGWGTGFKGSEPNWRVNLIEDDLFDTVREVLGGYEEMLKIGVVHAHIPCETNSPMNPGLHRGDRNEPRSERAKEVDRMQRNLERFLLQVDALKRSHRAEPCTCGRTAALIDIRTGRTPERRSIT